jgi:hypothetical protein
MTTKNNKRIQELAEQAGFDLGNGQSYKVENFAELIVKECCDIFVELRTRPADLAALDVKKHFGVES